MNFRKYSTKISGKINQIILDIKKYHFPYFYCKYLCYKILPPPMHSHNVWLYGRSRRLFKKDYPKDINEKIRYLEFYTDTTKWTELADKYRVRKYVEERIGAEYLVPLIGKWKKADDIDFNILPNQFILKLNNGSGDSIIVHDKSLLDLKSVIEKLNYNLYHTTMFNGAERHYLGIPPCIIAEKLLPSDGPIVDYKIWCFNGVPNHFLICTNRNESTHHANLNYYDLNWVRHSEKIAEEYRNDDEVEKPKNIEEMLRCAKALSKGFPQVRVDLYNIRGKIYFGELTFTSAFGFMNYYTQETLDEMGEATKIPPRTIRDVLISFKNRYIPIFANNK